jgi:hypothetical protein
MAVTSEDLKEYLRLPHDNITVVGEATIDRAAFTAAVKRSGLYVFSKIETGWLLNGAPVSLTNYGITPGEDETEISVDCFTINVDKYLAAAKSKAISAGVPVFENNAQYDLFITALAAMYYENRAMAFEGQRPDYSEPAARNIINSFVNELRYAKEDE